MPFTLSLFHQVRRFNIAWESLMAHRHPPYTEPGRLAVRETALCRADLTLESARRPLEPNTVVARGLTFGRDWSVV